MGKRKSPIADELESLAGRVPWVDAVPASTERLELCREINEQAGACRDAELLLYGLPSWVIAQWDEQVKNRPMENIHRKALDGVWRQVYAKLTGKELPRPNAYSTRFAPLGGRE